MLLNIVQLIKKLGYTHTLTRSTGEENEGYALTFIDKEGYEIYLYIEKKDASFTIDAEKDNEVVADHLWVLNQYKERLAKKEIEGVLNA